LEKRFLDDILLPFGGRIPKDSIKIIIKGEEEEG
jgi:hypothetical protein